MPISDALEIISDALKVIPDALKMISDALKMIPDDLILRPSSISTDRRNRPLHPLRRYKFAALNA